MKNPYDGKPDYQFWRRSLPGRAATAVDPVTHVPFTISKTASVATAGSCFAQHIARHLSGMGFNYFVPENRVTHEFCQDENYGTFSARYGNIYTVRQLWQLMLRAYGLYAPKHKSWVRDDGRLMDPFRPRIQSGGFATLDHLLIDQASHLEAVRRVFEESDVFIFTLGLTEAWVADADGAVVPLAPGTVSSVNQEASYSFRNFSVFEMAEDLSQFIKNLRKVNSGCSVILTVSPVALVATYEDEHVLVANTYSKSALRVVAEIVASKFAAVSYFPSYEMITGPQARAQFFADDLREVRPEGVAYVMSVFGKHYLRNTSLETGATSVASPHIDESLPASAEFYAEIEGVICDEEQIVVNIST